MARGAARGGPGAPGPELSSREARRGAARGGASRLLLYGASRTTIEGIYGLRGIALASLLGAEGFGLWTVFRLVIRYGTFASLGLERGIELEVVRASAPDHRSQTDARTWGRAAAGYQWIAFGLLAVCLTAASFAVEGRQTALVLRGLAAALLLDRLWVYGRSYLRAAGGLRRLATRELGYALLQLAFTLPLAAWGGPIGAFAGFSLATAVSVGWLARDVPFVPQLSLDRLRRLVTVGLPLSAPLWLSIGLTTIDRLVVALWGDAALLGSYAFAVALGGVAGSAALTIRTVVFPQVFAATDERGSVANASLHLRGTVRPFAMLLPPLLGAFGLLLAPLVDLWLPEYRGAVPAARLFVFGGVFGGLQSLGLLSVAAAGRERPVPLLAAAALALNAGLSWLALAGGCGLIGVAVGALVARGAFAVAVVGLAAEATLPRPGLVVLWMIAPSVWSIAAMEGIGRLVPIHDLTDVLTALGFYAASLVPLVPPVLRQLRDPATR